MSLSGKIGIAMGTVAGMAVFTVGLTFVGEKFLYMGRKSAEKRYAATRLKQAGEARDEA